ncbi:UNVERIFIED_CONTAM: hypothetical protein GTU68_023924 [Idotea baltica]|nr:hypothetical protein [Idotea baltica]
MEKNKKPILYMAV